MSPSSNAKIEVLSEIAEMRRIHSAIETSLRKSEPICLLVTSSSPMEGKTLVAAGIAATAARQNHQRILAVDLNWKAPALHALFGLEMPFDVDELRSESSLLDLTQPSGLDNLEILAAPRVDRNGWGAVAETCLLGAEIMRQARGRYETVIVDTPSIFPTNRRMMDPVTLSKEADGVALVVLACVTPRQQVKRARMIMESSGARIVGVVVNKWKTLNM